MSDTIDIACRTLSQKRTLTDDVVISAIADHSRSARAALCGSVALRHRVALPSSVL